MLGRLIRVCRQFAFGHDELLPVSKGTGDDLGGWGATVVDALGTFVRASLWYTWNATTHAKRAGSS